MSSCRASKNTREKSEKITNEDFFEFLENFSRNKNFQISRIKFPFMFIHLNEEYTKRDTSFINQNNWVFKEFYFGNNDSYGQIYDNFNHKLRDTDERVFAWHGIGNGIEEYFYFKRINGLWYMIREEDLST
jgi:hypothetical protein